MNTKTESLTKTTIYLIKTLIKTIKNYGYSDATLAAFFINPNVRANSNIAPYIKLLENRIKTIRKALLDDDYAYRGDKIDFTDDINNLIASINTSNNKQDVKLLEKLIKFQKEYRVILRNIKEALPTSYIDDNTFALYVSNHLRIASKAYADKTQMYAYTDRHWKSYDQLALRVLIQKTITIILGTETHLIKGYDKIAKLVMLNLMLNEKPKIHNKGIVINAATSIIRVTSNDIQQTEPSYKYDFRYRLPVEYDSQLMNVNRGRWYNFLDQVVPNESYQKILQEYVGYCLVPHAILNYEKALIIYGNGANGKSVFLNAINNMIGDDNVSHITLQDMTAARSNDKFALKDKLVNISHETGDKYNQSIFRLIASGNTISNHRNTDKDAVVMDVYAKLMFASNTKVYMSKVHIGDSRRWINIPFNQTINPVNQDINLSWKLYNDADIIFHWALKGLQRLIGNGKFTDIVIDKRDVEVYNVSSR